ncbi:MAG: efflux RND transporter permease subunit, partial [Pirellulales bacterium]
MNLIDAFVHNPVKVAVGVLLLILFGFIGLLRMPMQLTPEVEIPTLTIQTNWPGATPQEVETEIILEQEEQLNSVEGVTKMTSEAKDSQGEVKLEFQVGTDMDQALVKVNARLNQVREYPVDAKQPVISTSSSSDSPIAWFILSPKPPTVEEYQEYEKRFPQLADQLQRVRNSRSSGLAMLRLRRMAAKHPEVEPLLPTVDVAKMRRFAEDFIEAEFERVPGVSNSNVIGGEEEELQVVVDPDKLAARGLTIANVRDALSLENKDTSGGDIWEGKRRWVVRTLGKYTTQEQVANTIIAHRNGAPVYIRHVGEVRLGYKKPDSVVRRFGTDCIAVNVLRTTGANVLDVMDGLREKNRELNASLLPANGVELTQVYDETDYIYSAVGLVRSNIFLGGVLTIAVLLVYLRSGRSTLVIALAIPVSLIGTFLMLNLMGRSLNVISLAGLAFAVGMLVDNAVVVLENIYRHWQMGKHPFHAAVKGTQEVWGAVIASTLTTLAVFLPVLFIEQEAGQLFRDIALAISSAVGLSLIVSVTVIPVAASRILRTRSEDERAAHEAAHAESELRRETPHINRLRSTTHHDAAPDDGNTNGNGQPGHGEQQQPPVTAEPAEERNVEAAKRSKAKPRRRVKSLGPIGRGFDRVGNTFIEGVVGINTWLLRGTIRRIVLVVLLLALAVGGTIWMAPPPEYLPNGNRNLAIGLVLPPPGYNLPELLGMGERLETAMKPYWDVDPDSPEAQDLDFPVIEDFFFVARNRQVFLGARAHDPLRSGELPPLIMNVGKELEGTIVVAFQTSLFSRGLAAGKTVDVEFTGPELEKLVMLGGMTMGKLGETFDATRGEVASMRPVPSLDLSNPELHVNAKPEHAKDMGVSRTDLGYTVNALVDGAYASDYYLGGDKIDLTLMGSGEFLSRTQDLRALPISTPSGQQVPLAALADITMSSGPEQINHLERQRAVTIEFAPGPGMTLGEAVDRINEKIVLPMRANGILEGGYRVSLGGTADKLAETWDALKWNLVLALLITYLLMAALFESWLYPFVIILSVPLGAVGGIAALALLNLFVLQPLDILTMLGFVILIGTVVNNPILIVHQALNHMREDGMTPSVAIAESVRGRIRPIFMTTSTTVLGLLPLVIMPGAGSELYRGLGAVVLGGLIVSTIFTLFLVPTLFSLFMDVKAFLVRVLRMGDRDETRRRKPPVIEPRPQP